MLGSRSWGRAGVAWSGPERPAPGSTLRRAGTSAGCRS